MLTKSTVDLRSLATAREEEPIHYEFDRKFLFRCNRKQHVFETRIKLPSSA